MLQAGSETAPRTHLAVALFAISDVPIVLSEFVETKLGLLDCCLADRKHWSLNSACCYKLWWCPEVCWSLDKRWSKTVLCFDRCVLWKDLRNSVLNVIKSSGLVKSTHKGTLVCNLAMRHGIDGFNLRVSVIHFDGTELALFKDSWWIIMMVMSLLSYYDFGETTVSSDFSVLLLIDWVVNLFICNLCAEHAGPVDCLWCNKLMTKDPGMHFVDP